MWGILVFGLLIELLIKLYDLLMEVWPFLVAGLALILLRLWVLVPLLDHRAREARDRLRHAQARQQIGAIEHAAMRAMFNVAHAGEVIEGTAAEIEPTDGRPR